MTLPPKPNPKMQRRTNPKTITQNEEDRLSDLPDHILHHILSLLNTKHAFQTSILSTRWKNLLKHLPTLKLTSLHFKSFKTFDNLVSRYLSLRDDSAGLHTVDFVHDDFVEPSILKSIVKYAVSHHLQRLHICLPCDIQEFRHGGLFSCKTLTYLHLTIYPRVQHEVFFPRSLKLPALTTLILQSFYFHCDDDGCADPFSAFKKLNTLILRSCIAHNAQTFSISSATLVHLTIYGYFNLYSYKCKLRLSAPSLCNFSFIGIPNQNLCQSNLCSVKHVYIDADIRFNGFWIEDEHSTTILTWLQELNNIKSLTISWNTLQVLSFVPDLFKLKFTSLCNLESLQVNMKKNANPFIFEGIIKFLLQNSPSAKIIFMSNVT